jgi:hypothetical protein
VADAATIAVLVIDVAVALLAAYAAGRLAKKNQQGRDDKPTTVSERGAFVNWFLGLRRLGVVFGWAGLRRIKKESAPGGKGALFGGGAKVPIYYESGLHIISTGIVDELRQIQQNGKVLFKGPITRQTHPSGTTLDLGKEGAFTIYWGEQPDLTGAVPPVDSEVNGWYGIDSRSPLFCRVDWNQKRLGSSPNWPAMEYTCFKYCRYSDALLPSVPSYSPPTFTLDGPTITIIGHVNGVEGVGYFVSKDDIGTVTTEEGVHYRASMIKDNDQVELSGNSMASGTYTVLKVEIVTGIDPITFLQRLESHVFLKGGLSGSNTAGSIQLYSRADDDGLNPAHALAELMFAPWPFGLARDTAPFNLNSGGNSLDAAAVLFADEGLKASLLAKDGASGQEVISALLQDTGMLITLNTTTGLYDFVPIRASDPNDWPEITLDQLAGTFPEIETPQGGFADRANQFRDRTIVLAADGQASYGRQQSADNVQMMTVIDFTTAEIVAKRRSQESLAGGAVFRLSGNRTVRELLPGMVVTIEGVDEPVRILSVEIQDDSAEVKIEASSDFMGAKTDETSALSTGAPAGGEEGGDIEAPLQFDLFQVPASISATMTVIVPQIRASAAVADTTLNISADDTSYYEKDSFTSAQAGGVTTTAMLAGDVTGPGFDELGPDMDTVQDLSSDSASFTAGRQILMIVSTLGTEICYVDAITSTGGLGWTCNNIIRARQGTTARAHPIGSRVYIFDPEQVPSIQDVLLQSGATIYVKPVPGGLTSAEVGSKNITLV